MTRTRSRPRSSGSCADAVVAGVLTLDLLPALDGPVAFEPGQLTEVGAVRVAPGGAVANTGLALHRLGIPVRLVGRAGDDLFGSAIARALADVDPHLSEGIVVAPDEVTSFTIVLDPPGLDRCFLHCPGANRAFAPASVPYDELAGARVFHFGYPPLTPLMYADGGAPLAEMFARVHAVGPATSLDMCVPDPDSDAAHADWPGVLAAALPEVDVFAPSIGELLVMLGIGRDRETDLGAVADSLFGLGATVVMIKLGAERGIYLRTTDDAARIARFCDRVGLSAHAWRHRDVRAPAQQPRQIEGTTGAGDAAIAGLLAAILHGATPSEAARAAAAVGACSVEGPDPTSAIPTWSELIASGR